MKDECRRSIGLGLVVEDVDRFARRRHVNPLPADLEIVFRIWSVGDIFLGGNVDEVFDQGARKTQTSIVVERATLRQRVFQDFRYWIPDSDVCQHVECRVVDAFDVAIAQGFVGAAFDSRVNGHSDGTLLSLRVASGAPAALAPCSARFHAGLLRRTIFDH